jgi:hypothetical protein
MTTAWTLPTIFSQYAEPGGEEAHVQWNDSTQFRELRNLNDGFVCTQKPLLHIARSPKHDILMKTYFLKTTGFQFRDIPTVISGVECKLTMNRSGRIMDDTVSLYYNDDVIGENQATMELAPIKTYGGETSIWNSKFITREMLQNNSFGVVIRFKSHPNWPHKSTPLVDAVELRIH